MWTRAELWLLVSAARGAGQASKGKGNVMVNTVACTQIDLDIGRELHSVHMNWWRAQ